MPDAAADLRRRVESLIRRWDISVERTLETETSFLAFGHRGSLPVVMKTAKSAGDEWRSGAIVQAFEGRGVVRVYDHTEGALLLERLRPGHDLAGMALSGRDDEATDVLAGVIGNMSPNQSPEAVDVESFAGAFERYAESGDQRVSPDLLEEAHRRFLRLCASQRRTRLLHGDLHHYNVLFDSARGWLAIDPKGVTGEIEYEIGAALRNPCAEPKLFAAASSVERRLRRFRASLNIDAERALAWSFAQAVLAAVWEVEDGRAAGSTPEFLALAGAMRPMLPK